MVPQPTRRAESVISGPQGGIVKAYVREVLSCISATPPPLFQQGMLPCLHAYLHAHKDALQADGMWSVAEQFMLARPA